jgi:hypothetical protein
MTAPEQRSPAKGLAPMSRSCHECSASFLTYRRDALHCSRKCKTDGANREAARGKQLYRLAYGWRSKSGGSFSDLSRLVDLFMREDREEGRPPPPAFRPLDMTPMQSYMTKRQPRLQAKSVAKIARKRAEREERR